MQQRLARVVARELPRLGNRRRGAHVGCLARGRRRVIAPGSTWIFRRFVFLRSPPSSSYGVGFVEADVDPLRARRLHERRLLGVSPSAVRLSARVHCSSPSAVTTPSSSRPSSGRASSNASMPPRILPTLPTSTQLASPSNHLLAVDADPRAHARAAEVLRAGEDVGERDRGGPSAPRRRRGSCARRSRRRP